MARGEIVALVFSDGVATSPASTAPIVAASIVDTTAWTGLVRTVTYDLTAYGITDSKAYIWAFMDLSTNNYKVLNPEIDFPSATSVRVTFGLGFEPDVGTYRLLGK